MTGERAREAGEAFRGAARMMRERALALRRSHLVWWEGVAAEEYARRVRDRVAGLELAAEVLEAVAALLDRVAELTQGIESGAGGGWGLPA